jgi:alkylhydroperoxidase family enzyme
MDVPLFSGTEEALAYGGTIALEQFPTLVRTYFATQHAMSEIENHGLQAKADLAYRLQTLREAIEGALDSSFILHPSSLEAEVGAS